MALAESRGRHTPQERVPAGEVVPRALPVTRKSSFPFGDDATSPFPRGTDSAFPKPARLRPLIVHLHPPPPAPGGPAPREHRAFLAARTSRTPDTRSLPAGRLGSRPPPVRSLPSRSDSGSEWGSVSHPENLPLFPLTQPPPPRAHTDTQSEADTTPQPTRRSPPLPRNFPSGLPPPRPLPAPGSPGAALAPVPRPPPAGHSHLHSRFGAGTALPDSRGPA